MVNKQKRKTLQQVLSSPFSKLSSREKILQKAMQKAINLRDELRKTQGTALEWRPGSHQRMTSEEANALNYAEATVTHILFHLTKENTVPLQHKSFEELFSMASHFHPRVLEHLASQILEVKKNHSLKISPKLFEFLEFLNDEKTEVSAHRFPRLRLNALKKMHRERMP